MGWFSKVFGGDVGKIVGAVVGTIILPGVGTVIGAGIGGSIDSAKAAESAQEKQIAVQEAQIAAQKAMQEKQLAAQIELAGQQRSLTEKQMQLQMGQRQIEILASLFDKQDRTEPEIYYLPAAEPTSPVERINLAIDEFVRK